MKKKNIFLEKTVSALDSDNMKNSRLGVRGFEIYTSKKSRKCVLVIGLNPAGGDAEAEAEKEKNRTYLYSINANISKNHSPYIYNPYYKPIYSLINNTLQNKIDENNAKWHWCNKYSKKLEKEFRRLIKAVEGLKEAEEVDELKLDIEKIMKEFSNHQKCEYSIYIGDMFYYHETKSDKLPLRNDISYEKYCREMLDMHINALKEKELEIEYIYINNAKVSKWLSSNDNATSEIISGIKVFYGSILSGGRMDVFSRQRLVREIRSYLCEKYKKSLLT